MIGSILGAIATAIIGGVSVALSVEQANKNVERQDAFNERNSITGRVQEAKENGISPLAVLGNTSSSSVVSAPQANADYSGLANIGSSISDLAKGFNYNQSQEKIAENKNKSAEQINKMTIENEKNITNSKLSAESKNLALQLNTQLQIASDKNSTDTEITRAKIKAEKYIEQLKQQNSEFMQNKAFAQSVKEIELQQDFKAEENKKDRSHDTAMTWINNVQHFISNLISTAGSLAKGFIGGSF